MSSTSTNTFDRREILRRMGSGFGLLGLASVLGTSEGRTEAKGLGHEPDPPQFAPRARRIIFLFMNGGPSHVDTFDPKPLLLKHAGEVPGEDLYRDRNKGQGYAPSPFKFRRVGQSGLEVSELFPKLARHMDDLCVIRSMQTDIPNHEPALLMMQTGHLQPVRPSLGSWLLYGLGQASDNLPGFVVLQGGPRLVVGPHLWNSSFLPARFQGTSVQTADVRVDRMLENMRSTYLTGDAQDRQVRLLHKLNHIHRAARGQNNELDAHIRSLETAFRMQTHATEAFDLGRESESMRKAYGTTPFGNGCLLARRLIERGVRVVQVYYTKPDGYANQQPWDTHRDNDKHHRSLCADSDHATAALLEDLKRRGLLDDTLVIWGGEFGRTPYIETKTKGASFGRDHHHTAFSMLLAGGGVRGGMAYGATDDFGMHVVDNPVHPHDLHATILHLMGLDHERLTYRFSGRDFRLTELEGNVLGEILA